MACRGISVLLYCDQVLAQALDPTLARINIRALAGVK
jgi:hypothetical protein